jgi:hypothetical protein
MPTVALMISGVTLSVCAVLVALFIGSVSTRGARRESSRSAALL